MKPTALVILLVSMFALLLTPLDPHVASAMTCVTNSTPWSPTPGVVVTISAEACQVKVSGGFVTKEFHMVSGSTNNSTIIPLGGTHEFAGLDVGTYIYDHDTNTNGIFSMDSATFNKQVTCVSTFNQLTVEYVPTRQNNTLVVDAATGTASSCV